MAQVLGRLEDLDTLLFDQVVDVRSPSEFAEDHVPGAINLPVLSDAERAKVGTIYVRQDRFLARKIGAALVSRNAATHLEGPLADRDGGWRPLVYCWRGGQRSGSFTTILKQVGWRADTIEGGYKSYRRCVAELLYDRRVAPPVVVIDGGTGTAKTRLLHLIADEGGQMLDLEAMAEHRGSVFGPTGEAQPSQKMFESRLAESLRRLDPARTVFVEAESSKIGQRVIPPMLWQAMGSARRIRISAPLAARARHLVESYPDMVADSDRLDAVLGKLVTYHGHSQVADWRKLAAQGAYRDLAATLITTHYDPRYQRMTPSDGIETLELRDLSEPTLRDTARRLLST
ncbi:tRNA 2-selenouridine(34) synthase MnmH [Sulfitobacter sp. D35]|uniref:tRNA 2-selenouridine(34) synthase MnmH n=1 Tax=Sulfitobacter sp. D35 TaxID=3083252 RepID=UPI00296E8B85|nr:tRNA 2-selenouridine(34) synthase MnmH [Sulfitobacter sp. D35]MDW4496684.1 tRNA 2-selenouridine(34) synthase MnmH [Sulfitobacter sp. D35]